MPNAASPVTVVPAVATLPLRQFLAKVAAGNTFEIESSKLAITRSKSAQVLAFTNQMVTDHSGAGE